MPQDHRVQTPALGDAAAVGGSTAWITPEEHFSYCHDGAGGAPPCFLGCSLFVTGKLLIGKDLCLDTALPLSPLPSLFPRLHPCCTGTNGLENICVLVKHEVWVEKGYPLRPPWDQCLQAARYFPSKTRQLPIKCLAPMKAGCGPACELSAAAFWMHTSATLARGCQTMACGPNPATVGSLKFYRNTSDRNAHFFTCCLQLLCSEGSVKLCSRGPSMQSWKCFTIWTFTEVLLKDKIKPKSKNTFKNEEIVNTIDGSLEVSTHAKKSVLWFVQICCAVQIFSRYSLTRHLYWVNWRVCLSKTTISKYHLKHLYIVCLRKSYYSAER